MKAAERIRVVPLGWKALEGWPLGPDRPGARGTGEVLQRADLAVLPLFADERPLGGLAAYLDWRSGGKLTALVDRAVYTGALGERVLCPAAPGAAVERILLMGLGTREEFDAPRAEALAASISEIAQGLEAKSVVVAWPSVDATSVHEAGFDALNRALEALEAVEARAAEVAPRDVDRGESPTPEGDPAAGTTEADAPGFEAADSGADPATDPARSEGHSASPEATDEAGGLAPDGTEAPAEGLDPEAAAASAQGVAPLEGEGAAAGASGRSPEGTGSSGQVRSPGREASSPRPAARGRKGESGATPSVARQWWIVAPQPLCTRFRGRLLGTPRPAEAR